MFTMSRGSDCELAYDLWKDGKGCGGPPNCRGASLLLAAYLAPATSSNLAALMLLLPQGMRLLTTPSTT